MPGAGHCCGPCLLATRTAAAHPGQEAAVATIPGPEALAGLNQALRLPSPVVPVFT